MEFFKILLFSMAYCLFIMCSGIANAVKVANLWDKTDKVPSLSQVHIVNNTKLLKEPIAHKAQLFSLNHSAKSGYYEYRLRNAFIDSEGVTHARYDEFYKKLPVLWADVIVHNKKSQSINGTWVTEIENDLTNLKPKLTKEEAIELATLDFISHVSPNSTGTSKLFHSQLVIYPYAKDQKGKPVAHLAYQITYFTRDQNDNLSNPNYIIDAHSGLVLHYFDNVQRAQALVGTGPGGNTNAFLTNGQYNYGAGAAPLLGYLLIQTDTPVAGQCTWGNNMAAVVNLKNATNSPSIFPVLKNDEVDYPTEIILGCNAGSNYLNLNDNGQVPGNTNGGLSPDNDSLYYATQTYRMFVAISGNNAPFGSNSSSSPAIRYYVNINSTDASAYPAGCGNVPDGCYNQQIILGNGQTQTFPQVTYDTVGHETAHIYIGRTSNLIYAQQSGGINEAFADMAGATLGAYIGSTFPFFPPTSSRLTLSFWGHGALDSKINPALRYLNNPPQDGVSIDNAANFVPGMDVHYSSGVYNKAFYLMSVQFGNNYAAVLRAFQYMVSANDAYWTANTNYFTGACGVMQAAYARRASFPQDFNFVKNAFTAVGVHCLRGLDEISVME